MVSLKPSIPFSRSISVAKSPHRDIVASTLFPVLCPLFFATAVEPALRVDDGLTSIVNFL